LANFHTSGSRNPFAAQSKLRASRYDSILGNPETSLDDHSEFNEEFAKLERHVRRAFSRRSRIQDLTFEVQPVLLEPSSVVI
jgi:hypothetical protein